MSGRYLLDLNVLIALIDDEHQHYDEVQRWFATLNGAEWATCPLTEAGLIRYVMNPATAFPESGFAAAIAALRKLTESRCHRFWPILNDWVDLTVPFASRIFGHQQVTDAYLLGLAIKENGILVTFDRGLKYLAGPDFARNLLILD